MTMSWHTINRLIWALALLLQVALVVAIIQRRLARTCLSFAVLATFYPLRSVFLFLLQRAGFSEAYDGWANGFSALEICLEAWIVVELTARLLRPPKEGNRHPAWTIALCAVAALTGALATLAVLPRPMPVDRTQLFFWWAMLVLGLGAPLAARSSPQARNRLRIGRGFAVFSFFQLLALFGRTHAFAEHRRKGYVAWSYLPAIGYMAVVVYWLMYLRREEPSRPAAANAPGVIDTSAL